MTFVFFAKHCRAKLMLMLYFCYPVGAFSTLSSAAPAMISQFHNTGRMMHSQSSLKPRTPSMVLSMRGGEQEQLPETDKDEVAISTPEQPVSSTTSTNTCSLKSMVIGLTPIISMLKKVGTSYSNSLATNPILTKSLTAGLTFGLSDWTAQRLEQGSTKDDDDAKPKMNLTRTLVSIAVGLFYFGPAAHYWYETIFRILPGTSLFSTLQKAALGQLIFGPVFTSIFFATSLMQAKTFTIGNWVSKIKNDLPGAWLAGVGFWPLVDFVSYAFIPLNFIPLFINMCSFVWTIYLSMVANRA